MESNSILKQSAPFLLFVHIEKAGGTTLTSIINRQYQKVIHLHKEIAATSLAQKAQTSNALCGHFTYGIHHIINRPCCYISMMRHPIEQAVSWFYFAHKNKIHAPELYLDISIEEYIDSTYFRINPQTFYLTGNHKSDAKLAKNNIDNRFSVVGISELFEESVYLMKRELNWNDISYQKLNVNSSRPAAESLPPDLIDKILEKN